MNKTSIIFTLIFTCFLIKIKAQSGNVGIGTLTPDPSAVLDIQSTDKGMLIPRMTNAQIGTIVDPAIGLQVFSLSDSCVHIYNGSNWLIDCALELDPKVGENTLNYLPKWDGTSLVHSTSVYEDASGNVGVGNTTPEAKLDVSGTIKSDGFKMPTDASLKHILKSDASGNASWQPLVDPAYLPESNPVLSGSLAIGSRPSSVAVQGSFAYVVDHGSDDLKVIDVSDPTIPVLSGSLAIGSDPRSVAVQGNYAYVVDKGSDDLKVIDVSEPTNPVLSGSLAIGSFPVSVAVKDNYAYVVDMLSVDLKVIDVSDPANPVLSGSLVMGIFPFRVAVQGNYAYVTDQGSDDLKVIDVSDPTIPVLIGSLAIGPRSFSVAVQGNYAYVVDLESVDLKVIDVSDPINPFLSVSLIIGLRPGSVAVQGNYAYVVDIYSNDIKVIDISDPTIPVLSDSLIIGPHPLMVAVQDNYAYVIDEYSDDLKIIKLSEIGALGVNLNGDLEAYIDADADPTNELQNWSNLPGIPTDFSDGMDDVDDADADPTNELQNWSNLPGIPTDFSDETDDVNDADFDPSNEIQTISKTGNTVTLSNSGGTFTDDVNDADYDPANELQDWSNLPGIPAAFSDDTDDVDDADADPTNELQNWSNLPGIPTDFSDGTDEVNDADFDPANELISTVILNGTDLEITEAGATIIVDLSNLFGIDSTTVTDSDNIDFTLTDNDVTAQIKLNSSDSNILESDAGGLNAVEQDPEVGFNTTNYLPKWNGTALQKSISVFENGNGFVGIGTDSPEGILNVKVPYFYDSIQQVVWTEWIGPTNDIWQSFYANDDGIISSVGMITEVEGPVTISIYGFEGVFNSSTLLYSETVDANPFDLSLDNPYKLATPVQISGGLYYTIRIQPANPAYFGVSNGNPYSDGTSNLGVGYDYQFKIVIQENLTFPIEALSINHAGDIGIGRIANTNKLEVEGEASKTTAGSWIGNSDKRLKKNIQELNSQNMLQQLLTLQGVTYEWNDTKTGTTRPEGIQYGFIAQNIQKVFPSLVAEDNLGYLQTAYGTYDAMTVEAIRALNQKIEGMKDENKALNAQVSFLQNELMEMKDLKKRMAKIEASLSMPEASHSKLSDE